MNIKKYLYHLLDLPTQEVDEHLVSKGIGYEVYYLKNLFVVKVKLSGSVSSHLMNHIHEQIFAYGIDHRVENLLLDLNEPFDIHGKLMCLRVKSIKKVPIRFVVVLLPDWSRKKNYIRYLNLMGYQQARFFFSYVGAINWISAKNRTKD